MGRQKVKEIPDEVQRVFDYMNGKGMQFASGIHHQPKSWILEAARGFLAAMIEVARSPVRDKDLAIRLYHRIRFEDGYMRLEPLAHEHPIFDQILKLHEDELKRLLLCPGCKQFVWRKKIDSQTCSRKCADRWNNEKKKQRRNKQDGSL